jgi:hypothetical protein
MPDIDEEYFLTLDQKSIEMLLKLRCKLITPEDVLVEKPNLSYQDALVVATRCNEMIIDIQRYLYRMI